MICNSFDKKSRTKTTNTGKNIISEDQQLDNKLPRPITKSFKNTKYTFRDKNRGTGLADMELISKYNK